jgi:hypothetical protein
VSPCTLVVWDYAPDPPSVRVADGQLLIRCGGHEAVYAPLSDTRFVGPSGLLDFEEDEDGTIVPVSDMANRFPRRA